MEENANILQLYFIRFYLALLIILFSFDKLDLLWKFSGTDGLWGSTWAAGSVLSLNMQNLLLDLANE